MTTPPFFFCSSSAYSISLVFTVSFRYVFSQNSYLLSYIFTPQKTAIEKYTLLIICYFSVLFSEIISCTLCLKTSMPYVHPWYAKCDTSPGLVVISVFNCQGAVPLSSELIITQKTEHSRISTNPEKRKKNSHFRNFGNRNFLL